MTELVLDAHDPELLARFWCEVLGYVELERDETSIEIGPPGVGFGGPQPTIVLSQTDEPKIGQERMVRRSRRQLAASTFRRTSSTTRPTFTVQPMPNT